MRLTGSMKMHLDLYFYTPFLTGIWKQFSEASTHFAYIACTVVDDNLQRQGVKSSSHDDVIKWKHFPRNWPFVRGIHRSPVNSPHKGQWRGALMFSLICVWINDWVNNREAGDLRRYRAHCDVIVMNHVTDLVLPNVCGISNLRVPDCTILNSTIILMAMIYSDCHQWGYDPIPHYPVFIVAYDIWRCWYCDASIKMENRDNRH